LSVRPKANEKQESGRAQTQVVLPHHPRLVFGLLLRKERWRLTWRGWLLGAVLAAGLVFGLTRGLYPFLSVTNPKQSDYLVAEGWIRVDALREVAADFEKGGYRKLITSGCRVQDQWDKNLVVTYADWGASKLRRIGVATNLIQAVPSYEQRKDRTYSSALAVKKWFDQNHIPIQAINVATLGPHARRTRLLYEKAFGPDVQIGIIALNEVDYQPDHWWQTSEGVREVVGESLAYIYARFLFRPPAL
jgi:hypothetical protein